MPTEDSAIQCDLLNTLPLLRMNSTENHCTVCQDNSIESETASEVALESASEMDDDYCDTEQSSDLEW